MPSTVSFGKHDQFMLHKLAEQYKEEQCSAQNARSIRNMHLHSQTEDMQSMLLMILLSS
jgi:hypothetical protein